MRYTEQQRREAAEALVATMSPTKPHGSPTQVAESTGISVETLKRWRKEKGFLKLIKDAKAERYRLMMEPVIEGDDPVLVKLVKVQNIMADRLLTEVWGIPPAKLAAALKDIHHITQLKEGKPTAIEAQLAEEISRLKDMSVEELRTVLADKLGKLEEAGQSVENPYAREWEH